MDTVWIKGVSITCLCVFTAGGLALIARNDYLRLTTNNLPELNQELSNTNSSTTHSNALPNYAQTALLFGQIKDKPENTTPQELPETRLDLTLKGTFTHENSAKASALIAETNKSTDRFFVGDKIPGGAELVAVRKGEITLRRNGQDELLKLPFFKIDDKVAQRADRKQANALAKSSRATSSPSNQNHNKPVANNPRQQQLKDRLARLRNNRSTTN